MGSLRMKRSDMDGDNSSPFSRRKLDQIKKILHRDVDKELDEAIKIAKEINSRIYQVHRNILVYQKLNPSRKLVFPEHETQAQESCPGSVLAQGDLSGKSCGSSEQDSILRLNKESTLDKPNSSQTCFATQSGSNCSITPSNSIGSSKDTKKSCVFISSDSFPCIKFHTPNKGNDTVVPSKVPVSGTTVENETLLSDSQSVEVDEKTIEVANRLWLICLDHDYLKENVWVEQTKHRKFPAPVLSPEKSDLLASNTRPAESVGSSPPNKKIKIDPAITSESSCKLFSASGPVLANSILSGINFEDVKFDDFLNSSTYFDQDLMTFDQNPFSHSSPDLSSICDISTNFDDEFRRLHGLTGSTESTKYFDSVLSDSKKLGNNDQSNSPTSSSPVKLRFTIGTVSKQLLPAEKSCHETHIWKIYVRNTFTDDAPLDNYIAKIRFVIHDSYAPNNLVERKEPPYEITRRGWGEFPIRVQIFFRFNKKPICLVHELSLVRNVINILTLGIQKNYEIVIPNLLKSFLPAEEKGSSSFGGARNNGLWRNPRSNSVVRDLFDFKIKEINTVAKINELISQETVPNVNGSKTLGGTVVNISSWSMVPFNELKTQLFAEDDFYANFSDVNQIRFRIRSITNYCERIVFLLDILPIITQHAHLKWYKRVHPYTCPSKQVFNSWPFGKQRASEFGRARVVKSLAALDAATDWSTNEIVVFARNKDTFFQNDPAFKASLIQVAKAMALQQLSELEDELAKSESNEIIDIL